MKLLILVAATLAMVACASNPHKAKKIDTEMERSNQLSDVEKVGVKNGNLVVQKKIEINERLRTLQNDVYSLEDKVYGNRKYGSSGLYGALRTCRKNLTSKKYGGTGKLMWTEPRERITDKEDKWDVGIDEKDKIVAVTEEFLKDRITRFKGYKKTLMKRQDEYEEKVEICDAALEAKKIDYKKKQAKSQ